MELIRPYSVERSAIMKNLLLSPASGWPLWVVVAIGIAIAVVGFFTDERWIVVGILVLLAVAPSIYSFMYFFHTLSPAVVANLLPHTLERLPDADGYLLRIWHLEEAGEDIDGECWTESGSLILLDSNILYAKTSFRYEMIYYKDSQLRILFLPRFKK